MLKIRFPNGPKHTKVNRKPPIIFGFINFSISLLFYSIKNLLNKYKAMGELSQNPIIPKNL